MKIIKIISIVMSLAIAGYCLAEVSKIFLNGVDISGLKNQTFQNATVKLDSNGNVIIVAPQYRVKGQKNSTSQSSVKPRSRARAIPQKTVTQSGIPTGGSTSKRYYLVTSFSVESRADFDIDLFFNGKFYKRILSQDDQIIEEVTNLLIAGENKITMSATKNVVSGAPISTPESYLQVIVGEARMQNNQVVIERPVVNYRLTGAQSGTFHKTFTFNLK